MSSVCLFLVLVIVQLSLAANITISNVVPRRDTAGNIMDIHDGNTVSYKGVYYYYGASYGMCQEPSGNSGCSDFGIGNCGFRLDHNVSLYTSTDMATWTFQGHVFQMTDFPQQQGILFCPKVLYNAETNMWVMWFNWIAEAGFQYSYYAVAVSPVPTGPFKVVVSNVTTLAYQDTGDFALFQDDDGSGYVIYTSHIQGNYAITHQMSIEKLADDYLSSLGSAENSGFFGQSFVEAPTMFKVEQTYYAVFGQCCCYCQVGSSPTIYSASSPLGPYQTRVVIGGNIPAQQTNIVTVNTDVGLQYWWQGDEWQSAPDGIKGHDFQYWGPLLWDLAGNPQGPLPFLNNFTANVIPPA